MYTDLNFVHAVALGSIRSPRELLVHLLLWLYSIADSGLSPFDQTIYFVGGFGGCVVEILTAMHSTANTLITTGRITSDTYPLNSINDRAAKTSNGLNP
jgi:hypothetical protein